jgi:hypothetical protein
VVRSHVNVGRSACDDGYLPPSQRHVSNSSGSSLDPTPFERSSLHRLRRRGRHFCDHREALRRSRRDRLTGLPFWLAAQLPAAPDGVAFLSSLPSLRAGLHFSLWNMVEPATSRRPETCVSAGETAAPNYGKRWPKACPCRKLHGLFWRQARSSFGEQACHARFAPGTSQMSLAMSSRPPSPEAKVDVRAAAAMSRLR